MATARPYFSVIIPTYARADSLRVCLQAVTKFQYPQSRFEVIVVDDGSPSSLEPVVSLFTASLNLQLVTQKNSGPAVARNTGASHASGRFLAFTDDDCAPHPAWLQVLADRLTSAPDKLVGGQTLNALPENPFSTASQQLVAYLYAYYGERSDGAGFFASNNMAVSADGFHRIGGFSSRFPLAAGEDREFCARWRDAGQIMEYVPQAIVHHAHELTLLPFWRQHFNYGRGALLFHRARSQRAVDSLTPEPLSFYLDLLRFPFSQNQGGRAWLHSLLIAGSQVANASGFFWEAMKR